MSKVKITTTCQVAGYGMKKPRLSGDSLNTKSAKSFRFNARDLGLTGLEDIPKTRNDGMVSTVVNSTITFKGEADVMSVFNFLNSWDSNSKTPDYMEKVSAYNEQKQMLSKVIDTKVIEGKAKVDYYNRLKAYCFKFYKVTIFVTSENEKGESRITHAKTHYRLRKFTEADLARMIKGYKSLSNVSKAECTNNDTPVVE